MGSQPNILWVCTDSQRWDTLGCYGNSFVRTPVADELASTGVLLENCFAQNPLCTPSRGCFLTGRYPVCSGLRQNGQNINPSEKLVTRLLADGGYVCGLVGKLHINACDHRLKLFGEDAWKHDSKFYFKGIEPRIDDGYSEFFWDHAPSGTNPCSSYTQWVHEKGHSVSYRSREDCPYISHGMPVELHQTTFCAEKAINFIHSHKDRGYPWLFSVNIFDPHFDVNPPDEFLARYLARLDEIPLPNYIEGELDSKPSFQKLYSERKSFKRSEMTSRDHRMCRAGYWAMCDLIDVQLGRILRALDESGQRENTIVIFTSDHGEMLGDHGLYIKGPFFYDPALRVPLIVSMPGTIPAGRRVKTLVELGDLAPTLLEAAGLPRHAGMQTCSLWPLLINPERTAHRDDVYCEYYNSNANKPSQYATMVRTQTHKLVVFHGQELGELYDLTQDPCENRNLWNNTEYAAVKTDLLIRLCKRMAETADPLPERIGIF